MNMITKWSELKVMSEHCAQMKYKCGLTSLVILTSVRYPSFSLGTVMQIVFFFPKNKNPNTFNNNRAIGIVIYYT